MKKKKIIYPIIAVLVLVVCYFIGQNVVRPKRTSNMGIEESQNNGYYYEFVQKSDELIYEGYLETSDMPGGKTVGLVEDDVYGKWYLLSPNTSITSGIILDDEARTFKFDFFIHENVAHLSDGMQLNVIIIQEGTENILYENSLSVDGESKECSVDLSEWKAGNIFITMRATNSTEDMTGDWLVIKNARVD